MNWVKPSERLPGFTLDGIHPVVEPVLCIVPVSDRPEEGHELMWLALRYVPKPEINRAMRVAAEWLRAQEGKTDDQIDWASAPPSDFTRMRLDPKNYVPGMWTMRLTELEVGTVLYWLDIGASDLPVDLPETLARWCAAYGGQS